MQDNFIYEKTIILFFILVVIVEVIVFSCEGETASRGCYHQSAEVSSHVDTVYIDGPAVVILPSETLYVNPSNNLHGHGE